MSDTKCTAVIVAAGSGRRMGGPVSKQFLELLDRPVVAWTIEAFQKSEVIDEIVLVTGESSVTYVEEEIVRRYGFDKVSAVIPGGAERYDSVYNGLKACRDCDYVFIHDGVRPFVTEQMLRDGLETVRKYGTAICGMPSKDTVKLADADGVVRETPDRAGVWCVHTPQIFRYDLIRGAYDALQEADRSGITDDAMVAERMSGTPVHMYAGSYRNIKLTTPEDLLIARCFLEELLP